MMVLRLPAVEPFVRLARAKCFTDAVNSLGYAAGCYVGLTRTGKVVAPSKAAKFSPAVEGAITLDIERSGVMLQLAPSALASAVMLHTACAPKSAVRCEDTDSENYRKHIVMRNVYVALGVLTKK